MRIRPTALALLLLAAAAPALAVNAWYDYYLDARNKHIPAGRWKQAVASLREAQRLKPNSGVNERTYGMEFADYFPYYYEGLALLRLGEHDAALLRFNIEQKNGAILRNPALNRELLKLKAEAEARRAEVETETRLQRLRAEVDRLLKESTEHHRAGRYEEALSRLGQAQELARALDPGTQRDIQERAKRVREDQARAAATAERAQRIQTDLQQGRSLLEQGRPADAMLRFESVLALDAGNAEAASGLTRAKEEVLARTTAESRRAALLRGRELFDAGRYQEALLSLADAASDPSNIEARELIEKTRRVIEGLRAQKDLATRISALLAEAEALMAERDWDDAWSRLQTVLQLDPNHVRAREREKVAQSRMADETLGRFFPDQPPLLAFFEPRADATSIETWGEQLGLVGIATDDRGIVRIEFLVAGAVVASQDAPSDAVTGELARSLRFERQVNLAPGDSELKVVVTDSGGLSTAHAFAVTRRLHFHETGAFLPSAAATAVGLVGLGLAAQRLRRRRAVRRRFNPYIAGAPVRDEDMFFGRQKLLTRILNVLHHNSLMITGERRIGKTTFLFHLKRVLEADEATDYRFFPVSTDLQGVPEDTFFHAVMADIVEQLALHPGTRGELRFDPTHEAGYDGRDFSRDLQRVIEELKTRTSRRVKLALLIDEVDVLNEYSERVNQRLRSIFMKTFSEHLVAIMSGVGIRRIWNSEGSPWYNFFDEIELTAFSREEGEALIKEPVEGVFRFEAEAVEAILEGSHLKPYLIQKFCIHAVNRMIEDGRTTVTVRDVEAVRDGVLADREPTPLARPDEVLA